MDKPTNKPTFKKRKVKELLNLTPTKLDPLEKYNIKFEREEKLLEFETLSDVNKGILTFVNVHQSLEFIYNQIKDDLKLGEIIETKHTDVFANTLTYRELCNYQFTLTHPIMNCFDSVNVDELYEKYEAEMSFDFKNVEKIKHLFPNFYHFNIYEKRSYADKIFGVCGDIPINQYKKCLIYLKADKTSRRAIINLSIPEDLLVNDRTCTNTMNFLIRNEVLNLTVNMRSQDVHQGLEYDVFFFTNIQRKLAHELGVKVGIYTHHMVSMHEII